MEGVKRKLEASSSTGNDEKDSAKKPKTNKFRENGNRVKSVFNGKEKALQGTDKAAEKTDWRKFKEDKKNLKLKRKQVKDTYQISLEAKSIYEKLKCRRTDNKAELVEKLYSLLSGEDTLKKLVMAHDTARIIQCMLKFASPSLREQFSEKLLPFVVTMATSKYSHFCVLRMFKYGSPAIKSKLVDCFYGNIVKLATHSISSKILDHAYLTVASAKQKIYMQQEFYSDLYKNSKDENVQNLADTYNNITSMKASMLGSVKANLEHVVNKNLMDNSLVHAITLEYIRLCEEDKMEEIVTLLCPIIPMMLTTKDGCQAAVICFYKASSKNRRAIVKAIKEHLVKICTHEFGHIFIIALVNSLDDTKAIKKAIYDNIHSELHTLMGNQWGRRVLEWLVSPADTNCFHPTFIATMEEGLAFSKKDKDVRRREIFEQIEEQLVADMEQQADFWLSDRNIALVTTEILRKVNADNFIKVSTALAKVVAQPDWTLVVDDEATKQQKKTTVVSVEKLLEASAKKRKMKQVKKQTSTDEKVESDEDVGADVVNVKRVSGIEDAGMHIVLKKILKYDKDRSNRGLDTFGSILLNELSPETLRSWIALNRGCFILLNIVESNKEHVMQTLKQMIVQDVPKKDLQKSKIKGLHILLEKLSL